MDKYYKALDILDSATSIIPTQDNPLVSRDEEVEQAIETLEELINEFDKYHWHDLSKNPDDLPREDTSVLIYDGSAYYVYTLMKRIINGKQTFIWGDSYGYHQELDDVVTWKYIERFDDDE